MRLALDTNVMAYAERVERTAGDGRKSDLALSLLTRLGDERPVLPTQALLELHFVLVRRLRLAPSIASARVAEWAGQGEPVFADQATFDAALELAAAHRLAIFDAMVLAAAAAAGCDLLLSEDLQDGFAWRGVTVANPFASNPDARIAALLA